MPKTEDGYEVQANDLVWCISDPFTITSITTIRLFSENEDGIEFTFWLDPGDGEGDYSAYSQDIFQYQRNCLLAARRIAYEHIQCNEASIQIYREEINSIDEFLEGLE